MKKIEEAYNYLFYILYKRSQRSNTIFPDDFIASLYILVMEILIISSFTNYYNIIFNTDSGILSNRIWVLIVILLVVIDYIILHYKDQWKFKIQQFDNLPTEKNIKGKKIVYFFIIIIVFNFILSFYIIFAKAKINQTGPYAPEIVAKEKMDDSLQKAQQIENLKKIYGEDKK